MRGCPRGPELGADGRTLLEEEVRNSPEAAMEGGEVGAQAFDQLPYRLGAAAILQKRQDPSCTAGVGRCELVAPVCRSQGQL